MRRGFRGSETLVGKMRRVFNFMMLSFLFLEIPATVTGEKKMMVNRNPIVELSSREELVEMAGYGEEKLSRVTISGKILCGHACVDIIHHPEWNDKQELLAALPVPAALPSPVSGASVAVFCGSSGKSKKSWARGTTDEYGDFLIDLPSHLHAIPNLEKVCLLKVLHLPKTSNCRPASTGKHKGIKLLSVKDGARTYTTNALHLTTKPSKTCKNMARHVYHD